MSDEYEPKPGEKQYEIRFKGEYGLGESGPPLADLRMWGSSAKEVKDMYVPREVHDEIESVEVIHDPNPGGVRRCPVCETRGVEPVGDVYDVPVNHEAHHVTEYECHECGHLWVAYEPKDEDDEPGEPGGDDAEGDPENVGLQLRELRERVGELERENQRVRSILIDMREEAAEDESESGLFGWF